MHHLQVIPNATSCMHVLQSNRGRTCHISFVALHWLPGYLLYSNSKMVNDVVALKVAMLLYKPNSVSAAAVTSGIWWLLSLLDFSAFCPLPWVLDRILSYETVSFQSTPLKVSRKDWSLLCDYVDGICCDISKAKLNKYFLMDFFFLFWGVHLCRLHLSSVS